MTESWSAPASGLVTRAAPDAGLTGGRRIPPGLPLIVLERRGRWARVRCPSGWETWVEAPAASAQPSTPTEIDRSPLRVGRFKVSGVLVGAALAAASCFLPWLSPNGRAVRPFDVSIRFLVDDKAVRGSGPALGWLVLAAAAGIVVLLVRGGPLVVRRALGWLLVVVATVFVAQTQRALGNIQGASVLANLGMGVFAAAAGGVLVGLSSSDPTT